MTIAPLFQSSATTAPIWLGTAVQNSMHTTLTQPARFSGMFAAMMNSSSVTQGDEWSQQKIEGLQTIRNSLLNTAPAGNHAQSLQELAHVTGISKNIAGPVEKPLQHPESAVKLNELTGKVSDYLTGQLLNPSTDPVPQEIQDAATLINAATIQADSDPLLEPFKEKWASDLGSLQGLAKALPIAETIVEPSETEAASDFVSLVQEAVNTLDADSKNGHIAAVTPKNMAEPAKNEPFIPVLQKDYSKEETVPVPPMTPKNFQTAPDQQTVKSEMPSLISQSPVGQDEMSDSSPEDQADKPLPVIDSKESTAAAPFDQQVTLPADAPKSTVVSVQPDAESKSGLPLQESSLKMNATDLDAVNSPAGQDEMSDSSPEDQAGKPLPVIDSKESTAAAPFDQQVTLPADAPKSTVVSGQPDAESKSGLPLQENPLKSNTTGSAAADNATQLTAKTEGETNENTPGKELLAELKNLLSTAPAEKGVIKQASEVIQLLEKAIAIMKGSESPALQKKEATVQEKAVSVINHVQELAQQLTASRPMTPGKSIETVLTAILQSLPEENGIKPEGKHAGMSLEGKQAALLHPMMSVQQRLTTVINPVSPAVATDVDKMHHTVEHDLAQPVQLNLLQLQSFGNKAPAAARSQQPDLFGQFQSVMKQARFGKVNGAEKLLIRLQPEHLGSLKIELTRHEGQLSARVTASTAAGKEMLESQIHQLRQALTGQNIEVDKLDVIFAQEEAPLLKEHKDDRNQSGDQPEAQDDHQEVTQDFKEIFMNVEV